MRLVGADRKEGKHREMGTIDDAMALRLVGPDEVAHCWPRGALLCSRVDNREKSLLYALLMAGLYLHDGPCFCKRSLTSSTLIHGRLLAITSRTSRKTMSMPHTMSPPLLNDHIEAST